MATVLEPEIRYFHHGRFEVAGGILPDAVTAYQSYGDPGKPCIVFPTCYGAKLKLGSESLIAKSFTEHPIELYMHRSGILDRRRQSKLSYVVKLTA